MSKFKIINRKEGRKLFDRQARRYCGMSGKEFIRKWKAKEFKNPDQPKIMQVAFLLPFAGEKDGVGQCQRSN